jgi:hypothetical protein
MRDAIITGVLFITVSTGWYFGYVRPADTARAAIMDCMIERGDTTRVDYDVCVAALSEG